MTDQIIREWLSEWSIIKHSERENIPKFAESILANEDLFQAITHVLEESERFKALYDEIVATLFKFYQTPHRKLHLFCTQFIPSLIYVYLLQTHSQKNCVVLETFLLGIFELENESDDKVPSSARIPNINLPSIYHDPGGVGTTLFSDSELNRVSAETIKNVERPKLVFTEEKVRATQRLPLCTEIWWIFNHRLPDLKKHPVSSYLETISKIVTQGFIQSGPHRTLPPVRIIISSKLLIEMVQTIYFSVYNGAPTLAKRVLEESLTRANYQLWADAMLVCNAVKNYLKSSEIPIQVEATKFKKSIITNASFRTKKLPEDIPIVESDNSGGENEAPVENTSILAKSKSKLPLILSKMKRNSVIVINEEGQGDVEILGTPPERKKSIDATPV